MSSKLFLYNGTDYKVAEMEPTNSGMKVDVVGTTAPTGSTYTSGVYKPLEFQWPDSDNNLWETHTLNNGDNSDSVEFKSERFIGIWVLSTASCDLKVQVSPDDSVWADANVSATVNGFSSFNFETPFRYIRLNCVNAGGAVISCFACGK